VTLWVKASLPESGKLEAILLLLILLHPGTRIATAEKQGIPQSRQPKGVTSTAPSIDFAALLRAASPSLLISTRIRLRPGKALSSPLSIQVPSNLSNYGVCAPANLLL
jgi:hypothetical protein